MAGRGGLSVVCVGGKLASGLWILPGEGRELGVSLGAEYMSEYLNRLGDVLEHSLLGSCLSVRFKGFEVQPENLHF